MARNVAPRRVVVTGIGVVSAIGNNIGEFWRSLEGGRSGIAQLQAVDPALLRFSNAAEVRDFAPSEHFDEKEISLLDRFAQFGVVAARQAIAQAGIEWTQELRESAAIITGRPRAQQTARPVRTNLIKVGPA